MDQVLILDDDRVLADMLREYLAQHGIEASLAHKPSEAFTLLERRPFDLLVLDVMLPETDGLRVLERLRGELSHTMPVLMLTARGDDADRIVGLEMGADDYLPKPFNPRELLARVRALIRRDRRSVSKGTPLVFGSLEIDPRARTVRLNGESRELTSYQFDLLMVLARHAGRVMTRAALSARARGADVSPYDRSIDVQISRIRAAVEENPKKPRWIVTVRGAGYVFVPERPQKAATSIPSHG